MKIPAHELDSKWKIAQTKERSSWLETDMTSKTLLKNWEARKKDFGFLVERIRDNSSILDVGSGPISVLHTFPRCRKMVALDSLNDQFKNKYDRLEYIEYVDQKAENINFPDMSFSIITCINALDHMDNYEKSLAEMIRCLKPGGVLYLEYENTSPLSVFLSRLGYKKPLSDFHPILVENYKVFSMLKKNKLSMARINSRPQLSLRKISAIFNIIMKNKAVTSYEQNISVLNYGFFKAIVHYIIIAIERLMFIFFPRKFGYFISVYAIKRL